MYKESKIVFFKYFKTTDDSHILMFAGYHCQQGVTAVV